MINVRGIFEAVVLKIVLFGLFKFQERLTNLLWGINCFSRRPKKLPKVPNSGSINAMEKFKKIVTLKMLETGVFGEIIVYSNNNVLLWPLKPEKITSFKKCPQKPF